MVEESFPQFINPTPLGKDFIRFDFLTPDFCDYIIQAAENQDWSSNRFDAYKTQDVYLEESMKGLYDTINLHLEERIWPSVIKYWDIDPIKTATAFVLKYSMESQKSLHLHHDESHISGSVKLNEAYEGAVLKFPRQDFTNEELKVGQLLCWPSKITHPHLSTELRSGTKYSLTIWTQEENVS